MGIHNRSVKFFTFAKDNGVSFGKTVTLGRQSLQTSSQHVVNILSNYLKLNKNKLDIKKLGPGEPIDYILTLLGATSVDSIDYSDFEHANIIHDLNTAIPLNLKSQYDVVIDSGTLEHIFNFPVAISNCMQMIKPGGHFIGISPVNNVMGHGFYQFSPELYFRIFAKEYGFQVQKMFLCTRYDSLKPKWFEVMDPDKVRDRITLENKIPIILYVIAKKHDENNDILRTFPQQSDYSHLWKLTNQGINMENEYRDDEKYTNLILRKISDNKNIPPPLKKVMRKAYNVFFKKARYSKYLGSANEKYIKRVII